VPACFYCSSARAVGAANDRQLLGLCCSVIEPKAFLVPWFERQIKQTVSIGEGASSGREPCRLLPHTGIKTQNAMALLLVCALSAVGRDCPVVGSEDEARSSGPLAGGSKWLALPIGPESSPVFSGLKQSCSELTGARNAYGESSRRSSANTLLNPMSRWHPPQRQSPDRTGAP